MKVIDLLNKIANNDLPHNTKFKIISYDNSFLCRYDDSYPGEIWVLNEESECSFNYKIDHMRILNYEVEILEDKTEEIEELDTLFCMSDFTDIKYCKGEIDFNFKEMQDKINELVRLYNSLIKKQDTSKETNCMSD